MTATSFTREPVDRILLNGRFVTVDATFSIAEAVAISSGRIVAVGPTAAIQPLASPETVIDDLGGATVLPGLIDAHTHMLSTGALLQNISLYACRTIADILDLVRDRAETTPEGRWIIGRGWDETLLEEGRYPTRWELDEAAPNHPVVLSRVWNKLVCNSRALAIAGIDRTTPQPAGDAYAGGFDLDTRGEPTGLFRDNAKQLDPAPFAAADPRSSRENSHRCLSGVQRSRHHDYRRSGTNTGGVWSLCRRARRECAHRPVAPDGWRMGFRTTGEGLPSDHRGTWCRGRFRR